jgi:hypothetical protein
MLPRVYQRMVFCGISEGKVGKLANGNGPVLEEVQLLLRS